MWQLDGLRVGRVYRRHHALLVWRASLEDPAVQQARACWSGFVSGSKATARRWFHFARQPSSDLTYSLGQVERMDPLQELFGLVHRRVARSWVRPADT